MFKKKNFQNYIANNIWKITFRLKRQTAYDYNYRETLFLIAIIIITLHNVVDTFQTDYYFCQIHVHIILLL